MYLSVFIYSVEGVGQIHVCPIKTIGSSILIVFPTCLSTCVFAYLCAPGSRRQDTSSVRSRMLLQTEREWQANFKNPIFLPGIVLLLLTVL